MKVGLGRGRERGRGRGGKGSERGMNTVGRELGCQRLLFAEVGLWVLSYDIY